MGVCLRERERESMSPVQTRSRSSLIASAPMKEMTLLNHSTRLKRGRVNFHPKSSRSCSSSSASSSTCLPSTPARRGGKMACRNKVLKEFILQKTELMGLELNVCGCMGANNEARHESATASHAGCTAGNGNGLYMDEAVKGDVLRASCNGERVACAGTVETSQAAGQEEWDEESCTTPKAAECRIPADAGLACPPAPRKRKAVGARLDHRPSPFSTLSGSGVASPLMILPRFIDAFFCAAENGSSF